MDKALMRTLISIIALALMLSTGQVMQQQVVNTKRLGGSLNPCLIGAWPMNEGSGLTLNDTTSNANTATIATASNVIWQSNLGLPGTTPFWNGGTGAAATSTTVTNFNGSTPFSLAVWSKADTATGPTIYASTFNTAASFIGWELQFTGTSGSSLLLFELISNLSNRLTIRSGVSVPTSISYIVVTYDGSKTPAGVKMYINGVLDTSTTVPDNSLTGSTASGIPVSFGVRSTGGGSPLNVPMAFFGIYNCVLTQTQITTYNAAGPGIY